MAKTRLRTLPQYPAGPVERNSSLFIERDVDGGGTYVSEYIDVDQLLNISFQLVSSAATLAEGDAVSVDTTAGEVIITLPPSPAANDTIFIADYAGTFATNNCVVERNGENIMGLAENMSINTNNVSIALKYVDATQGWRLV